ncbi:hypothetical protein [Sinomonas sp. G460-2]|uniref:hypothetical protein n=1 Tax=Sinomonas sp. G460-2 TaxID=3393464 RepID=UPI0039F1296F
MDVSIPGKTGADEYGRSQLNRTTWLDRTIVSFGEALPSPVLSNLHTIVWITSGDNLEDAWEFWNIRALRPISLATMPMYLLPAEDLRYWLEFDRQLNETLERTGDFSPDVLITSLSTPNGELSELARHLHLDPLPEGEHAEASHGYPPSRRTSPFIYMVTDPKSLRGLVTHQRRYGISTHSDAMVFEGTATVLRFPSPVDVRFGMAILRLNSSMFDGLPRRRPVASLIHPQASWKGDELEIFIGVQPQIRLELNIPTQAEVLPALLSGIAQYALSDKGSLASALMERKRNYDALLERNVYETIRSLTSPRSSDFKKLLKELGDVEELSSDLIGRVDSWGVQARSRAYRSAERIQGVSASDAAVVLERLCELGWAERGFEIKCSACSKTSFVQLTSIPAGGAVCPACGSSEMYRANKRGPEVFYRLDGLIDESSSNGIFPNILAIAALKRSDPLSWLLPAVDLRFKNNENKETDIIGLYGGRLVIGEVKTSGSQFNAGQVDKDVDVAKRLEADIYVMAAMDQIPQPSQDYARQLCCPAGIEIVILDETSLRP